MKILRDYNEVKCKVEKKSAYYRYSRLTISRISKEIHLEKEKLGRMEDALASAGDEGRGKLRKIPGTRKQGVIRECPNGATPRAEGPGPFIYRRGEPGELKHLSTRRRRKKQSIPSVVASEGGRA